MKKRGGKKRKRTRTIGAGGYDFAKPSAESALIPAERAQLRNLLWIVPLLIAVNLIIYGQVRNHEFIGWDDPLYVSQNPVVSRGLTWEGVKWAFTTGHAANWHPLTWLSHMLDVRLFGVSAGPHHLVNAIFHIANSLLVFWVLFRMTAAAGRSAFVALLFAAHPLHVESVAWVAERKDVLSTLLLLLTVLAYIAWVHRPVLRRYILVHGIYALALMTKPMAVTLPVMLLLLDIWPLSRVRLESGQKQVWLKLIREKLVLIVMAAASSVVTLAVQWRGGTVADFEAFPLGIRAANAPVSYAVYLGKMLWPADLSAFYPYRQLPVWMVAGSILGLIGVSFLAIRAVRRRPYFLVGWTWYLVTLAPVIGLIQVGDQARADRYTYVPLIGIFIVLAWGVTEFFGRRRYRRILLTALAGAVICILTMAARTQARYWENAVTLWEHAVKSTGGSAHAHVNAGFAWMDRGEVVKAIDHYQAALRIDPNFAEAHNALGVALLGQQRIDEGMGHFIQALRIKPDFGEAHNNLGTILAKHGKAEEAISHLTRALRNKPGDAQIHLNMGIALAGLGRADEAIAHYSEALKIKPHFAEARSQLGNVLLNQGKAGEAVEQYREALRVKPDYAEAHHNLGVALMKLGRADEALSRYYEALRINPDLAEAHNSLGNAFIDQGRESDAIAQYKEALRIRPDYVEAHANLGMALINQMRDEEAIVHLAEAIRMKPDDIDARGNLGIALINRGREEEAVKHLNEVLRLRPGNEEAKKYLGIARARQRQK